VQRLAVRSDDKLQRELDTLINMDNRSAPPLPKLGVNSVGCVISVVISCAQAATYVESCSQQRAGFNFSAA